MREAQNMGTVTTFEKNLPQKATPPSPLTGEGGVPTKVDTTPFMRRGEGNAFITFPLRLHCHSWLSSLLRIPAANQFFL